MEDVLEERPDAVARDETGGERPGSSIHGRRGDGERDDDKRHVQRKNESRQGEPPIRPAVDRVALRVQRLGDGNTSTGPKS